MKLVDLNVLLYVVNRDASQHAAALAWWERSLKDTEPLGLSWNVILGFLRLATNGRVFASPLSIAEAIQCMDEWLRHPRVQVVNELPQHWAVFQPLLNSTGAAGNLTSDVHLAALAISHDATLVTCDHDFRRFPQLKTIDPTTVSEEGPA